MNINKKLREELKDKFKWYGGKDDYGVLYDNDVDYTFQSILKAIEEAKPPFKKNGVIDGVPASDRIDDAYNSGIKDFESVIKEILK